MPPVKQRALQSHWAATSSAVTSTSLLQEQIRYSPKQDQAKQEVIALQSRTMFEPKLHKALAAHLPKTQSYLRRITMLSLQLLHDIQRLQRFHLADMQHALNTLTTTKVRDQTSFLLTSLLPQTSTGKRLRASGQNCLRFAVCNFGVGACARIVEAARTKSY